MENNNEVWGFTKQDAYGVVTQVSLNSSADVAWDDKPLDTFIQFLRGCGYMVGYDELVYENNGALK